MSYFVNEFREIQYVGFLTTIIIGLELIFYFFYRYYLIRDKRLPLNKILVSYGLFILLGLYSGFLFMVNTYFISDSTLTVTLLKIAYSSLFLSPAALLYFILIEDFEKYFNTTLVKILSIISLIPVFLILFFFTFNSMILIFSLFITLGVYCFLIYFQIKIARTSTDNIRQRLIYFLIGGIFFYFSMFLIDQNFLGFTDRKFGNFVFAIWIINLAISFSLFIFGVYHFPAFYEFKWKENMLKLLIINQKKNSCLFSYDFTSSKDKEKNTLNENYDKFFSGGIMGIENIIATITDSENEKINKISQGDSLILLEYGEKKPSSLIYALMVKKDIGSYRYFLIKIKESFESFYSDILNSLDSFEENKELLFRSYDIIIKNIIKGGI
ncbi:MAG: hypothetical protein GF353_22745 [Candidatus Lokiarchaeota archaeon]|nr:hypothetical protein [Candidatus Lokiarchaeota archaeon]